MIHDPSLLPDELKVMFKRLKELGSGRDYSARPFKHVITDQGVYSVNGNRMDLMVGDEFESPVPIDIKKMTQ